MLSGIGEFLNLGNEGMAEKRVRRRGWSSVEWPTVGLIIGCYAGWGVAGLLIWPDYPVIALLVLGFDRRAAILDHA